MSRIIKCDSLNSSACTTDWMLLALNDAACLVVKNNNFFDTCRPRSEIWMSSTIWYIVLILMASSSSCCAEAGEVRKGDRNRNKWTELKSTPMIRKDPGKRRKKKGTYRHRSWHFVGVLMRQKMTPEHEQDAPTQQMRQFWISQPFT